MPAEPPFSKTPRESESHPEEREETLVRAVFALPEEPSHLSVGEYLESADLAELDPARGGSLLSDAVAVPPELTRVLSLRLGVLLKIGELELQRKALRGQGDLPREALAEINRQDLELAALPTARAARSARQALQARLKSVQAPKGTEAEAAHARTLDAAYALALQQWDYCEEREAHQHALLKAAHAPASGEPLYRLFEEAGIPVETLYGWAIALRTLEALHGRHTAALQEVRSSLHLKDEPPAGFWDFFRGRKRVRRRTVAQLRDREKHILSLLKAIEQELSYDAPPAVEAFWSLYERAAELLVASDGWTGDNERHLRAFLRYGMIGASEWFLPQALAEGLLPSVGRPSEDGNRSLSAPCVLYADEYIEAVAQGRITPSIDENLELNGRHTEAWKQDNIWRRIISANIREPILRELAGSLGARASALRKERARIDALRDALDQGSPDSRGRYEEYGRAAQAARVEAARLDRAAARIRDELLPSLLEARLSAEEKLQAVENTFTPALIARKEARAIHHVCRLSARLKDPFPPFSLRDYYRSGTGAVQDRAAVERALAEAERNDPSLFQEPLFSIADRSKRIFLRFPPTVILAPCCGFLGYAWNPRFGPETGRMVLPAYSPKPGLLEPMLHNLLADFRWDTSKAGGGMDIMTSDTLVAAYSTMRWEYRHKPHEVREKAAIYSDESDRQNWRRHYGLYLSSAQEGGKRLFQRCPEAYEVVLRYLDLPAGVKRLKH
ncbi:MAG: hypothetical protein V1918_10920 [Planctomycetota bacterium]